MEYAPLCANCGSGKNYGSRWSLPAKGAKALEMRARGYPKASSVRISVNKAVGTQRRLESTKEATDSGFRRHLPNFSTRAVEGLETSGGTTASQKASRSSCPVGKLRPRPKN